MVPSGSVRDAPGKPWSFSCQHQCKKIYHTHTFGAVSASKLWRFLHIFVFTTPIMTHRSIVWWETYGKRCVLPSKMIEFQGILQFLVDVYQCFSHFFNLKPLTMIFWREPSEIAARHLSKAIVSEEGQRNQVLQQQPNWDANYWKSSWFTGSTCGENMDLKMK